MTSPARPATTAEDMLAASAPHIQNATGFPALKDWGAQPDALEGQSRSSGRLLYKAHETGSESGLWVCTPGRWRLRIERDEFCHFISGHALYRSDEGEATEITPGTAILFPAGWTGECLVTETIRNLYFLT
ncbi:cupin domain-containing protein [Acidocella sp.]|uniref:cupin domain-containing protein n=1 Tax=Acidocella sp. TaxID=50710 RepID=UPI003D064809